MSESQTNEAKAERRFRKIKFDGAKVRVEYEVLREGGGEPDEFTLQCSDQPRPEFKIALDALGADVLDICELPDDQLSKLRVRGVSVSWTNDIMGACITALKTVKKAQSPLVLNTPHLPVTPYGEGDDSAPMMSCDMVLHLEALMEEAARYVNGDRAQGSLLAAEATQIDTPELVAAHV